MVSRRSFLASIAGGSLAAVSGCTGQDYDPPVVTLSVDSTDSGMLYLLATIDRNDAAAVSFYYWGSEEGDYNSAVLDTERMRNPDALRPVMRVYSGGVVYVYAQYGSPSSEEVLIDVETIPGHPIEGV